MVSRGTRFPCVPGKGVGMIRRRANRSAALLAVTTVLTSLVLWATDGPAGAVNCTSGQEPFLALAQTVTTSNGNASYDLVVTNTGDCGATNIVVTVRLPVGSTFLGFTSKVRSWSCTATNVATPPQTVTCPLQSQLDQRSTNGGPPSGTAEVVVTATAVSGGNKNAPPDTTEFAQLTDAPQPFNGNANSLVAWAGVINPKTGGNLHIDNSTTLIPGENALVNIPAGVGAVVNLSQLAPGATGACSAYPHGCNADLSLNAPVVAKGFSTITLTVDGASPVGQCLTTGTCPPLFDEGTGPQLLLKCKGQNASPPCEDSLTFNSTTNTWTLVIHDAGGTKYHI